MPRSLRIAPLALVALLLSALALAATPVAAAPATGPFTVLGLSLGVSESGCGEGTCSAVLHGQGLLLSAGVAATVVALFDYTPGTCASPSFAEVSVATGAAGDSGFLGLAKRPGGFVLCARADGTIVSYRGTLPIIGGEGIYAGETGTMQVQGNAGGTLAIGPLPMLTGWGTALITGTLAPGEGQCGDEPAVAVPAGLPQPHVFCP